MKTVQNVVDNRETDDFVVVSFRDWTTSTLYDGRGKREDVPSPLADYAVERITVENGVTVIEV